MLSAGQAFESRCYIGILHSASETERAFDSVKGKFSSNTRAGCVDVKNELLLY